MSTSAAPPREWLFLGVRVTELTGPEAPVVVGEAVLPHGASPPAHVHEDLDDSFYVLEGTMVVRCGESVTLEKAGDWVQFPRGVPHTFRVMSDSARILMVHANRSFLDAVAGIGRPATEDDEPAVSGGPSPDELDRLMGIYGMRNVGPPMEEPEANRLFQQLSQP